MRRQWHKALIMNGNDRPGSGCIHLADGVIDHPVIKVPGPEEPIHALAIVWGVCLKHIPRVRMLPSPGCKKTTMLIVESFLANHRSKHGKSQRRFPVHQGTKVCKRIVI